jgi:hypothetical protein
MKFHGTGLTLGQASTCVEGDRALREGCHHVSGEADVPSGNTEVARVAVIRDVYEALTRIRSYKNAGSMLSRGGMTLAPWLQLYIDEGP